MTKVKQHSISQFLVLRTAITLLTIIVIWIAIVLNSYHYALDDTAAHYLFYDAEQLAENHLAQPYIDDFKIVTKNINDLPAWIIDLWQQQQLELNEVSLLQHNRDDVYILPYSTNTTPIFVVHYFAQAESLSLLPWLALIAGILTVVIIVININSAKKIITETLKLHATVHDKKIRTFYFDEFDTVAIQLRSIRAKEQDAQQKERLLSAFLSHEVRTPLSQINHCLSLFAQQDDLPLAALPIIDQLSHAHKNLTTSSDAILALWQLEECHLHEVNLTTYLKNWQTNLANKGVCIVLKMSIKTLKIKTYKPLLNLMLEQISRNYQHYANGDLQVTLCETGITFTNTTNKDITQKGNGLGFMIINQACKQLNWHYNVTQQADMFTVRLTFNY
ncbi:HAMP domain-containing histidine kinase [Pseudoalteromonas neustonica]|uniref:histidine kinase n=2 Tax=Pseudoalteromonas TaxID=53246 RepID=A0A0N1EQ29_9GAMM|nr:MULTISPECIES: HAMP domain-containing histidine kinase [Pseudoalteromonas]KPH63837.1 hypothetical protein ADS77_07965 [Pseudoalteromonas porphyrae]